MTIQFIDSVKGLERKLEVRLAENQLEIEKALTLRYEVFNLEMQEGLPQSSSTGKDRDEYDYYCEHLIVLDHSRDRKIVGTYRILPKSIAEKGIGFYSENEFHLHSIYSWKENVAEVGRSCVHPEYRNGSVISLLWAGLGEYMRIRDVRFLMGCGSIHSTDSDLGNEVYAYLKWKNALADPKYNIFPLKNSELPNFDPKWEIKNIAQTTKKIPPLIKGYIRLGAKICSTPALDLVFRTIDFFVLFDFQEINERYLKRYG